MVWVAAAPTATPAPSGSRADRAAEADVLEILAEGLGVLVARVPVLRQRVQGHRVEVAADGRVVDARWLRLSPTCW